MGDRAKWYEIIKEWELSGQTQKAYCLQIGISYKTFTKWRTEYKKTATARLSSSSKFKAVKVERSCDTIKAKDSVTQNKTITLHCLNGATISYETTTPREEALLLLKQIGGC
jgi:hypothetical protein